MHSDAQFAGSSSVPAHVGMMGFMGMGNNPMVFAVGIFLFIEGEVNGWDMVGWDYVSSGLSVHQIKKRSVIYQSLSSKVTFPSALEWGAK